jgi:DNA-binding CsgD family transcriptional regulator
MLVVKDMERQGARSLAAFAEHFGLTPAQAALAHELIAGDGVEAAAGRLGLSRATVRTHLVRLFQKTGTRRQAELVRLMLEWSDSAARFGNDNGVTSSRR